MMAVSYDIFVDYFNELHFILSSSQYDLLWCLAKYSSCSLPGLALPLVLSDLYVKYKIHICLLQEFLDVTAESVKVVLYYA